jgi:hypothetical protein
MSVSIALFSQASENLNKNVSTSAAIFKGKQKLLTPCAWFSKMVSLFMGVIVSGVVSVCFSPVVVFFKSHVITTTESSGHSTSEQLHDKSTAWIAKS